MEVDERGLSRWSVPRILLSLLLFGIATTVPTVCAIVGDPALHGDPADPGVLGPALVAMMRAGIYGELGGLIALVLLVSKVEPRPFALLGFEPVPVQTSLTWCAGFLAFVMIVNGLIRPFDRELFGSPFLDAPLPAGGLGILFVAFALSVLSSELVFRGFLFGVLRSRGTGVPACVFWTTILYVLSDASTPGPGLHGFGADLAYGLLLGWARGLSGSILPPLGMHFAAAALDLVEFTLILGPRS